MYHQPPPPMSPAAKRVRVDNVNNQSTHPYPTHLQSLGVSQLSPQQTQQQLPQQPAPLSASHPAPPASVYAAHHSLVMSLDDEDLVGAADELDTISAREISASRYARHHEWMEQILGSAYQSDKIIPSGLFSVGNNPETSIWGSLEDLRERVAEMEEQSSGIDEFYTRAMVTIKEGKIAALKRGERRLARLVQREQDESGIGGIKLVENVDAIMESIVKDVETAAEIKVGQGDDGTGVVKTRWEGVFQTA